MLGKRAHCVGGHASDIRKAAAHAPEDSPCGPWHRREHRHCPHLLPHDCQLSAQSAPELLSQATVNLCCMLNLQDMTSGCTTSLLCYFWACNVTFRFSRSFCFASLSMECQRTFHFHACHTYFIRMKSSFVLGEEFSRWTRCIRASSKSQATSRARPAPLTASAANAGTRSQRCLLLTATEEGCKAALPSVFTEPAQNASFTSGYGGALEFRHAGQK